MIYLISNHFQVNGQVHKLPESGMKLVIKDRNGSVVGEVTNKNGTVKVKVVNKFMFWITKGAEYPYALSFLNNKYEHGCQGVCGNMAQNSINQMNGPKHCIYSNADLFKASWTRAGGKGCETDQLKKMEEKVQEFQKTCKKSSF